MGGVWFINRDDQHPLLWRARFPDHIRTSLVSSANRGGSITNSDLELARTVAHLDILANAMDIREQTIHNFCDNTPAVAWQHKGSTTTNGASAYLLRLNSILQRHYRFLARQEYLSGPANVMADDCSRLWALTDDALLAHFNSVYPQKQDWQLAKLRPNLHSSVISALLKQRCAPASFLSDRAPSDEHGGPGWSSAEGKTSTPGLQIRPRPLPPCKSLHTGIVAGDPRPVVLESELAQWRTPFVRLARRSPAWGPKTHALTVLGNSISG